MNLHQSVHPITLQNTLVFRSGFTIWIGSLWEHFDNRKIRESLLVSAVLGSCTGISNQCMLVLANQKSERYSPATELESIRFWSLPFGNLVWHISTQLNDGLIVAYIIVFYPRRGKSRCFIPFMVYALVYPNIYRNLVAFAALSPWCDSFWKHICQSA